MSKRIPLSIAALLAFLLLATSSSLSGIAGTPDVVPAASLLVPFFEVGVDVTTDSEDTLLVVTNTTDSNVNLRLEGWDVHGRRVVALGRRVTLGPGGSFTTSMRDLINTLPSPGPELLRRGDFYRGFVTIDVVSHFRFVGGPLDPGYPFSTNNALTGWIYYTRLAEGSSNGLPMVHLEWFSDLFDPMLLDFYQATPVRESLSLDARHCATSSQTGDPRPCGHLVNRVIDRVVFRVFLGGALNGATRVVLFTWTPSVQGGEGGPSETCPTLLTPCPVEYLLQRYDESGVLRFSTTVELPDVVNVLDLEGTGNGWVVIRDLPDVANSQVYGFVFNRAQPPAAGLNWDAIFEATLDL